VSGEKTSKGWAKVLNGPKTPTDRTFTQYVVFFWDVPARFPNTSYLKIGQRSKMWTDRHGVPPSGGIQWWTRVRQSRNRRLKIERMEISRI